MTTREEAGSELFNTGRVLHNNNGTWGITQKPYLITQDSCSCPDFKIRQVTCKHMYAVRLWCIANNYTKPQITIEEKFEGMINYLASKGNVDSINNMLETYSSDLIDEAIEKKIIVQTKKQVILIV
jgi:uncharacterized Zn finger protein